jgi:saccharopine dehydrogenase (NAD+, L-lysine-forming)
VSYTPGVPAMTGAMMMLTGEWSGKGVFNVEEFNPDPFLEKLGPNGLPWQEEFGVDLEV